MAKLSHNDSRRMYSWWWDSHISPKNSKWLQENLTDMDAKVKSMIKLIEEDADSFARRAEMYYKKRPELMKMVEEFYRAYRALAERYDHATGVIRQAHRTMSEACPDQFPMMFGDDSPASTMSGTDMKTPDLSLLNGDFTNESDSVTKRKTSGSFEHVRRGLNFDEIEQNGSNMNGNGKNAHNLSELDKESDKSEAEIAKLKEAIKKLETEKEAGLVLYQQSSNKLSQLEAEISRAGEDYKAVHDRAKEAEDELVVLKESLSKAEAEKESNLHEYQKCLAMISQCNERADSAESEVNCLKEQLEKLGFEKESALNQYVQSLGTISNLENELRMSEEDAKCLKESAEKHESEIETLKQTISKMIVEKESSGLIYQQCLEKISILELKLARAEEEAKCLSSEIETGVSKLKGAEEQCTILERSNQSLHVELESLMLKMGNQSEELTGKQKELGRLWACVQEERLRFVEAETAFQTLQRLHAQSQEELRAMACELQNRVQMLKAVETQNQTLLDEVSKVREENKNLDEINTSTALTMKDMREEISSLIESKGRLEHEVELRVDQRNALQQEIYCLKEELRVLNEKHLLFLGQVHDLGLSPATMGSSVKGLREENLDLKETCRRECNEKADLLQKLVIMDQLLEKNSLLESSLSDLKTELEGVRGKIDVLEQSCETLSKEKSTLLGEKDALITQLDQTNKNLKKLSEDNTVVVNSLSDAECLLESLKAKSKFLEDSCQLLVNEKAGLMSEKTGLTNDLKMTQTSLEELKKLCNELEGRCSTLENVKESTLLKVEELQTNMDMERQKRAGYIEMSETRLKGVEAEMSLLRDECLCKSKELDSMLCDVVGNETELFVLRLTSQEMFENNSFLLKENKKLLEENTLSKSKISLLEKENLIQKAEVESVSGQVDKLRAGNSKLLEVLGIVEVQTCKDRTEQDKVCANTLSSKVEEMKEALVKAEEENFMHTVDSLVLVTWIEQLKLDFTNIKTEKNRFECDVKAKTNQVSELREEADVLLAMNEELKSKLKEGDFQKSELTNHIEALNGKLLDTQETCRLLQEENLENSHEKRSIEEKNSVLSRENELLCDKMLDLENFSSIFRSCADEKFMALKDVENDVRNLRDAKAGLLGKLMFAEEKLQESKIEHLHLRDILQKSESDLNVISTSKDQIEIELKEAEKKISIAQNEKLHFKKNTEDLTMELNESKAVRDQQKHQIQKLSADNGLINSKLESKVNEIDELEAEAESIFAQLQYFLFSHLIYEQNFHALRDRSLSYMVQNEALETQLDQYGPEITSLQECLMFLENHLDIHIKFQNPRNETEQGSKTSTDPHDSVPSEDNKALISSSFADLHDLRVRLEAMVKSAIEIKDQMVQENTNLQSKLDASTRQLELLQSGKVQSRRHHHLRPTSEITEESESDNTTKDIVLDQVSDGFRRDHLDSNDEIVELWESRDSEGTLGLTIGKSKNATSPRNRKSNELRRAKSSKKPKNGYSNSDLVTEKDPSVVDKLEISKRSADSSQETNKKRVLERLDSDVQKLLNLQITVRDLKTILEVTEKGKRGKSVIECEALKVQLEEADMAIVKLFELSQRLAKNVEDDDASSYDPRPSSSFDLERDGQDSKRRRSLVQARKMSEKIGRLQMEIQNLQFILLKMDDESKGKNKLSEARRRTLLRDYLYGGKRTAEKRREKNRRFCACVQPSTVED